jgi:GntR family carbon starvation induced transcriptional regulator
MIFDIIENVAKPREQEDAVKPGQTDIITPSGVSRASQGTLTEQAYQTLRREIVSGRLAPEQPLRLEFLRDTYGFGFSPLREALSRLQSERLVSQYALRGFKVAAVSIAEMSDIIETRIVIETEALRRSIERGDDDWESAIVATFHALRNTAQRRVTDDAKPDAASDLESRHHDFHQALISACGSPWLIHLSGQLYVLSERYRRPLLSGTAPNDIPARDVLGEHAAIMDATLARESSQAVDLLSAHYRLTGQTIERMLEQGSTLRTA